jgi:hypothetical protein
MVSLPARPTITSGRSVPLRMSPRDVPTIVAFSPKHLGTAADAGIANVAVMRSTVDASTEHQAVERFMTSPFQGNSVERDRRRTVHRSCVEAQPGDRGGPVDDATETTAVDALSTRAVVEVGGFVSGP